MPPGGPVLRPLQAPSDVQEMGVWATLVAWRLQTHGRVALMCRWNQRTLTAADLPEAGPLCVRLAHGRCMISVC